VVEESFAPVGDHDRLVREVDGGHDGRDEKEKDSAPRHGENSLRLRPTRR